MQKDVLTCCLNRDAAEFIPQQGLYQCELDGQYNPEEEYINVGNGFSFEGGLGFDIFGYDGSGWDIYAIDEVWYETTKLEKEVAACDLQEEQTGASHRAAVRQKNARAEGPWAESHGG